MASFRFRNSRSLLASLALALVLALTAAPIVRAADSNINAACAKEIMAVVVHYTAIGLANLLKDIPDPKQRVQAIQRFLDDNYFYEDKSGYLFVYDFDGDNIAHGDKTMRGQNLLVYEDGKARELHKAFLDAVRRGGGYARYRFHKPGKRGSIDVIGYVEQIPGLNYYIGGGVFVY
jgi:signal transduction histidine kinase